MLQWFAAVLLPLAALCHLDAASRETGAGPALRALLIQLIEAGGILERSASGIVQLDKGQRSALFKLGVRVGQLDLFVPAMLKPKALAIWRELAALKGEKLAEPHPAMPPVLTAPGPPPGYRQLGNQAIRLDIAEKLLREAHDLRVTAGKRAFRLDPARAISAGLTTASYARLLQLAGFKPIMPKVLREGVFGPPAPLVWHWQPPRRAAEPAPTAQPMREGAFASLAELVR